MKDLNKFNLNKVSHLRKELHYVASPYTHSDPEVVADRVEKVRECVKIIMEEWDMAVPFSPVLYTAGLQEHGVEPEEGWYQFCLPFLKKADRLIVLMLDGWEDSVGIGLEIAFAQAKDIPIIYYSLDNMKHMPF